MNKDERRESLEAQVASFPDAPGVYLFKDARGRVLYVGKADVLRDRVRAYFGPSLDVRHIRRNRIQAPEIVEQPSVRTILAKRSLDRRQIQSPGTRTHTCFSIDVVSAGAAVRAASSRVKMSEGLTRIIRVEVSGC